MKKSAIILPLIPFLGIYFIHLKNKEYSLRKDIAQVDLPIKLRLDQRKRAHIFNDFSRRREAFSRSLDSALPVKYEAPSEVLFNLPPLVPDQLLKFQKGNQFHWQVAGEFEYLGEVTARVDQGTTTKIAVKLAGDEGRLVYQKNPFRTTVRVFYEGESLAHRFFYEDGDAYAIETTVASLRCAKSDATYPVLEGFGKPRIGQKSRVNHNAKGARRAPGNGNSAATGYNGAADFQSNPGAPTVIYLDFDGEVVNDPDWSDNVINAAPAGLDASQIHAIMCAVADDYSVFDVNVTNVRAVFDATPSNRRLMCISTPTDDADPGGGGVAFGDTFRDDSVCWNFNLDAMNVATATISHEVGHTLGLDHDGRGTNEYYNGHTNGFESWAPIMGGGNGTTLFHWSRGEYNNFSQLDGGNNIATEDDYVIMSQLGIDLRADDYEDNFVDAHPIVVDEETVTLSGIMGVRAQNGVSILDTDVFRVDFRGLGLLSIYAGSQEYGSNVDLRMRLYDSSMNLLHDENPTSIRSTHYQVELQPGIYYISLTGAGAGNPNAQNPSGWTSYGATGNYQLKLSRAPLDESLALGTTKSISQLGPIPWEPQNLIAFDEQHSLQNSRTGDGQTSAFSMVSSSPSISFRYKLSTEQNFDVLRFYVDENQRGSWSGEIDWASFTLNNLGTNPKTFRWEYERDNAAAGGTNTVWIDQIVLQDEATRFSSWMADNGLSGNGSADADGDTVSDLLEYASGSSPTLFTHSPFRIDQMNQQFEFTRNRSRSDLITTLQVSDDLENWTPYASALGGRDFYFKSGVTGLSESNSADISTLRFIPDPSTSLKRFMRVQLKVIE